MSTKKELTEWRSLGASLIELAEEGAFGPCFEHCDDGCACVICHARKLLDATKRGVKHK